MWNKLRNLILNKLDATGNEIVKNKLIPGSIVLNNIELEEGAFKVSFPKQVYKDYTEDYINSSIKDMLINELLKKEEFSILEENEVVEEDYDFIHIYYKFKYYFRFIENK